MTQSQVEFSITPEMKIHEEVFWNPLAIARAIKNGGPPSVILKTPQAELGVDGGDIPLPTAESTVCLKTQCVPKAGVCQIALGQVLRSKQVLARPPKLVIPASIRVCIDTAAQS